MLRSEDVIYFSLLFISPVVLIIFRKKEYRDQLALFVTCVAVFILLALRNKTTGVDLEAYYNMYETMKDYSFVDVLKDFRFLRKGSLIGVEWGYTLFTWIFASSGMGFQMLLAVQSAFCVFSIYHFVSSHSEKPSLSIVIVIAFGLIDYTYCILRQAISLGILLFSVDFVEKKKYPLCVLLVLVATLFHQTALSFIVALPLSLLPISWWTAIIFTALSASILPLFPVLNKLVVRVMKGFYHSTGYLSSGFEFSEMVFILLLVALFMTFFYTKKEEVSTKDRFIYWTTMLTIPLEFLSMYMPIFARLLALTFLPFSSVGITNAFLEKGKDPDKKDKALIIGIFVISCVYYGWTIFLNKRLLDLIPYKTFFVE